MFGETFFFFFFSSCCFRELSVLLCLSCLGVVRLPAQNSWAPPVTWLKRSLALTSSNAPLSFPPISWPVSCFADDALPSTHLNLLCLRHSPVSSSSSLSLFLPDCWTVVPEAYAVIQKSPPCGSNPRTRWVSPSRWKSCRLDRCSYFLKWRGATGQGKGGGQWMLSSTTMGLPCQQGPSLGWVASEISKSLNLSSSRE